MILFAIIINKSPGRSPKMLIYTSQCLCFHMFCYTLLSQ